MKSCQNGIRNTFLISSLLLLSSVGVAAPVHLEPYGFLRFEAIRDNVELARGDWMLYNFAGNSAEADRTVLTMTGRHSRIGIRLSDPERTGSFNVRGLLEVDFAGGYPNSSTAARQPLLLLRLAYVALYNSDWELLMGQDWALLSAPFPRTANFVAGAGLGNLWMRMPQLRLTWTATPVKAAVSLNRPMDANSKYDSYGSGDLDPIGDGERTGLPWVMGRSWATAGPFTLALFGHYGLESVNDTSGVAHDVPSWSMNGSLEARMGRFSFTSKGFIGENLNTFFGGVLQGVVARPNDVHAIPSFGGYGTVGYDLNKTWSITLGAGIDNPDEKYQPDTARSLNSWQFGNLICKPVSNLQWMFEVDRLETQYVNLPTGESYRVMFVSVYNF